jgi:hypothetical protein
MSTPYGLDPAQFLSCVIRPTLEGLALASPAAEVLVLGTALTESGLRYLDQIDAARLPGPAYGLYQMEAPTHADIWRNFLSFQPAPRLKVARLAGYYSGDCPAVSELATNLAYATAMCRVHYRRVAAALPAEDDPLALARYWKAHYNTALGAGVVEDALVHFAFAARLCADIRR